MAEVNKLGFGCVALTTYNFKRDALNMLELAFSNGITYFDTAPLYGRGYSEKILGSFIKNKRDKVCITTKVGLGLLNQSKLPSSLALPIYAIKKKIHGKKTSNAINTTIPKPVTYREISKDYVQQSLIASLKNLQTTYIDNYFLHEALPSFLTVEATKFLLEQKKQGVIKNIGIAAGYTSVDLLNTNDILDWDYLQYENNFFYNSSNIIEEKKQIKHNYHSVLKFLALAKSNQFAKPQMVGMLLNAAVRKNNSGGVVLFSTTKKQSLISNIKEFENANKFSDEELSKLIVSFYSTNQS